MRGVTLLLAVAALAVAPRGVVAGTRPTSFDFEFSISALPSFEILDDDMRSFSINLGSPNLSFNYLEFEVEGLTHTQPEDLMLILFGPGGQFITLMDGAGDGIAISGVDLIFTDIGDPLPHGVAGGELTSGIYNPDGSAGSVAFSDFNNLGTQAWEFVVIDGATGDVGSFTSATLRGVIPEPVTLSLLALGAVVAFRRKRFRA